MTGEQTTTRRRDEQEDAASSEGATPLGAGGSRTVLDGSQRAVIEADAATSVVVIGAPGTGKTTTLIELLADRVERGGFDADSVVALTFSRIAATALRDRLGVRLGRATNGPLARTVNSLAFDIVSSGARRAGTEPPRLITGGEHDADIAALLAGDIEDGTGPAWPETLTNPVRELRTFRTELRELMMRATEHDVGPDRLRELGRSCDHPEWIAAADFFDEYYQAVSSARPNQLDASELVQFAIAALQSNDVSDAVERLRLVVVDDLQEAGESAIGLLRALAQRGVTIVAFGDPDVATSVFRGGSADVVGRFGESIGATSTPVLYLRVAHRQGHVLRSFTRAVTERIGTAAVVGHRAALTARGDEQGAADDPALHAPIATITATSQAREWAAVARRLREHHLLDGVPWRKMAIVVRSGAQVPRLARALAVAEVPTRTSSGATALRDDAAARALLMVVDVGVGRGDLTAEVAADLLLGPFGGLDRLTLRRLRLALRAEEVAGGGNRSADELLIEAMASPGRLATIDTRIARDTDRLARTIAAVRDGDRAGASIEELIWLVWERSGRAPSWRSTALGTGVSSAEANRHLDGVVELFTAAKRFVEREPQSPARVFLARMLDADVPEDTLSPRASVDSVLVATPSGVVGAEFEVVAVAGLQEGVWPNMRVRGSLLHSDDLVRAARGEPLIEIDQRKEVLADELRMFALASSRASRRLILSATTNDDESPSVLLALAPEGAVRVDPGAPPLTLRGLTGRLRRELTAAYGSPGGAARAGLDRTAAASTAATVSTLAALAAERVAGADPRDWHGLAGTSTTVPLYDDDEQVPVSPSRLDAFEKSALDWFIDEIASNSTSSAMGVGTIVHWAMETATDPSVDALFAAIESRWNELVFDAPWLSELSRRNARGFAAAIADYLADFAKEGKRLVAAEGGFTLEVGRARVRGKIDRVESAADGSVVIVDLKTGRPVTNAAELAAHPQLGAYQLAYADGQLDDLFEDPAAHSGGGAKLLFVKEGLRQKLYREGVQAPLTEPQLEGFRERIRQAAIAMAAAEFEGALEVDAFAGGGDPARRALHRVRAVSSD